MTFGAFIKQRREALGYTVRGFAAMLGMTHTYFNDIEHGNKPAPVNFYDAFIAELRISGENLTIFHDLAAQSKNVVSPDIAGYINKSDIARVALRRARELDIPDEKWQAFIATLED
jgi:Predicted transcriptional regulators